MNRIFADFCRGRLPVPSLVEYAIVSMSFSRLVRGWAFAYRSRNVDPLVNDGLMLVYFDVVLLIFSSSNVKA